MVQLKIIAIVVLIVNINNAANVGNVKPTPENLTIIIEEHETVRDDVVHKEDSSWTLVDDPNLMTEFIDFENIQSSHYKFSIKIINTTTNEVVERINCSDTTNLSKFAVPDLSVDVDLSGEILHSAVMPKCCPLGHSYAAVDGTQKCVKSNIPFEPIVYIRCGYTMLTVEMNVTVKKQDPCTKEKYTLDPIDERFFVMFDGTLNVKDVESGDLTLFEAGSFCLESFETKDAENQTVIEAIPLICFDEDLREAGSKVTLTLYAIAMLISVPFLLVTLFIYLVITELRTVHGKALCCHVSCLSIAFMCLACVQLASEQLSNSACVGVAFIIQVSFVACFFWLNVMCIETYLNVKSHIFKEPTYEQNLRRFNMYCAYAWGSPLALLLISIFMDFLPIVPSSYVKPKFGESACWFETDSAAFPYFYLPVGLLIIGNIALFVLTSTKLTKTAQMYEIFGVIPGSKNRWIKCKTVFRTCIVLFLVMGINWVMEVISWAVGGTLLVWSVFDIFNALQGVVIFGIFVLQKNDRELIWRELKKKYNRLNCCGAPPATQSEMTPLS